MTALAALNADPELADKPEWIKRLVAGFVDVASFWENADVNNLVMRTLMTRRALYDVCRLIDYDPTPQSTSSGTVMFDVGPMVSLPYTAAAGALAASGPTSVAGGSLRYGTRASLAFPVNNDVELPSAYEVATGKVTVSSAFVTGEKLWLSSTVALPAGLSPNTDYYAIYVDATHIRLASSRKNAFLGVYVPFTNQGSGTHTAKRLSAAAACYQQTDVSPYLLGTSDGVTPFQEFRIPKPGVLFDTIYITVAGQGYAATRDSLALYGSGDKVVRVYFNNDGSCTLLFGNGVNGILPPQGDVYVSYSYGGGSLANVTPLNAMSAYAGSDANVTGCFNSTPFTGGAETEALAIAKVNAPQQLKARSRFITPEDGEALAMGYGGLALCKVNRNVYGTLSSQVLGVASGGGTPSGALRSAIAAYLQSLTPMQAVYVQFDAGTFTPPALALSVSIDPAYTWAAVSAYVSLAVRLFFSDCGAQVLSTYKSSGVASAATLINALFGLSLVSSDYSALAAMLATLDTIGVRGFGDLVTVDDLYTMVHSVAGVDHVTLTSISIGISTSLPYQCAAVEITTMTGGSVALTQV
jgi:hypothetical protein